MKKTILILTVITTLAYSCGYQEKIDNERNKKRQSAEQAIAEKSTSTISELPLGFNFGMTEEEVAANINKLVQDSVIRKEGISVYAYAYQLDNGKSFESKLDFSYYNDELYLLSFDIFQDNLAEAVDNQITNYVDSLYSRTSWWWCLTDDSEDKDIFTYWIKENQIIRLRHTTFDDDIWYINAPIYKIINDKESDKSTEAAKKRYEAKKANKGAVIKNSYLDASVSQVEKYLKNNVNDYEGIEWSTVVEQDNGNFIVRHKYRDSYGVYNKVFTLSPDGSVVSAVNFGS